MKEFIGFELKGIWVDARQVSTFQATRKISIINFIFCVCLYAVVCVRVLSIVAHASPVTILLSKADCYRNEPLAQGLFFADMMADH